MATSKPNTNELGSPGGILPVDKGWAVAPLELNPELQFPASIPIYDTMRSQDGRIGSVLSAVIMTAMRGKWDLDTEGVDEPVTKLCRTELGLPAPGEALARRRREGINMREHVKNVLETKLWAGFAAYEQVYEVSPPRPGQEELGLKSIVHLRKLAPRLPRTITRIDTEKDGGLKSITQMSPDGKTDIVIPVDRLVFYSHKKEGADWSGRSVLRQAYKHWMIRDVFIRLDAQAAERNSMGVPTVYYSNPENKTEAEEYAAGFRSGSTAGGALPTGSKLELTGVSGGTVDMIPRIKYHDQEISRTALAMFLDLGHDNGARSLGDTFLDIFISSVQSIADEIAETVTEHVIRDLVEHNFGVDVAYPALKPGDLKASQDVAPEVLKTLGDAGFITPDPAIEAQLRTRYGMPAASEEDTSAAMPADEMLQRMNVVGTAIRSGFDPADTLDKAGLPEIKHSGLQPVTVKPPETGAAPTPAAPEDGEDPDATASAGHDDGYEIITDEPISKATALMEQLIEMRKKHTRV